MHLLASTYVDIDKVSKLLLKRLLVVSDTLKVGSEPGSMIELLPALGKGTNIGSENFESPPGNSEGKLSYLVESVRSRKLTKSFGASFSSLPVADDPPGTRIFMTARYVTPPL